MTATILEFPSPFSGLLTGAAPLARVEQPAALPEPVRHEIGSRLAAGSLLIDCPCCGYGMTTKLNKRGYPFANCQNCRFQLQARSLTVQEWFIRLAASRLDREREVARVG